MRVGFGDGEFAVCGACHPPYGRLVGDYLAFDPFDGIVTPRQLAESLMLPLLKGEPLRGSIIRISPRMHDCSGLQASAFADLAGLANRAF